MNLNHGMDNNNTTKMPVNFWKGLIRVKENSILRKLSELRMNLEKGIFPSRQLDIKGLKGKWGGFLRLRVGEIRVIFRD